jgi:hypothetical protein
VAGLTLALHARDGRAPLPPPLAAWVPFLCTRGADISLELSAEPPPAGRPSDLLFDSGGVWQVFRHEQGLLYTFRTTAAVPPLYKALAIDHELTRGTLYWPPPYVGRHPLDFPVDQLLFQHRFVRSGRLEVHCSAVVIDGRAWLFCGHSGAGKTTTARLWRRFRPRTTILSDDRAVLNLRQGRAWAHGTPWHGTGGFETALSRPLAGICFLEQAKATSLSPIGRAEAGALLFARSFPPLWAADGVGAALELCGQVIASVPCYRLAFRKDRSAVEAVLTAARA